MIDSRVCIDCFRRLVSQHHTEPFHFESRPFWICRISWQMESIATGVYWFYFYIYSFPHKIFVKIVNEKLTAGKWVPKNNDPYPITTNKQLGTFGNTQGQRQCMMLYFWEFSCLDPLELMTCSSVVGRQNLIYKLFSFFFTWTSWYASIRSSSLISL